MLCNSRTTSMPFTSGQLIRKCHSMIRNVVIAFGSQNYRLTHKQGKTVIDWADITTCLGVTMLSILNLTNIWHSRKIKPWKLWAQSNSSQNKPYKKAGYWLTLACVAQYWSTLKLSLCKCYNIGLSNSLPDWEDGDIEITDYLFWQKYYKMKSDIWHYYR